MPTDIRDIEFVTSKKCIDFNLEFYCPHCFNRVFQICTNLGTVAGKSLKDKRLFYCSARSFSRDCSERGCPKYVYSAWEQLENYRKFGLLLSNENLKRYYEEKKYTAEFIRRQKREKRK